MLTNTEKSKYAKVIPPTEEVVWNNGFWKDMTEHCARNMVPNLENKFAATDISHVVENFRICAGKAEGEFGGSVFGDGDFYKWMEAAAYAAYILKDKSLYERLDAYISLIGEAQQDDGYISTKQIIESRQGKGLGRMSDINDFEVYNMGHLFTSACLYFRLSGKSDFLAIAEKAAGYLENMYAEAEKKGEVKTAVCPSHYMGLIELYRTTKKEKYLVLAEKAVKLRDSVKNGLDDNQDRIPLKKHEKIVGHAVRASYLYAGLADLYAEEGDAEYYEVLQKVWGNMVSSKLYLTGGIGALYNGVAPYGNFFGDQKIHQAFGYEYQLPNITAYNETCASIGLVMWAYRMFLIEPKAEYFDVLERAMLNVNLAAVSLDGKNYFYENMLRRTDKLEYKLVWPLKRTSYLISYCCPPNLARTIMESAEYAYTTGEDSVWCGLYGGSQANFILKNGAEFMLEQKTAYPYDGKIEFNFSEIKKEKVVKLMLRIPAWAESGKIIIRNIKEGIMGAQILKKEDAGSYIQVMVNSMKEIQIELQLDMPVRYTIANPMIEEDIGQAAIEKGPLVYCMERADLSEMYADQNAAEKDEMLHGGEEMHTSLKMDNLWLNTETQWKSVSMELQGETIMALQGEAWLIEDKDVQMPDMGRRTIRNLYKTLSSKKKVSVKVQMIPYFAWDNRGMGEMRIWFPYSI